jgi:hypothetical protein
MKQLQNTGVIVVALIVGLMYGRNRAANSLYEFCQSTMIYGITNRTPAVITLDQTALNHI